MTYVKKDCSIATDRFGNKITAGSVVLYPPMIKGGRKHSQVGTVQRIHRCHLAYIDGEDRGVHTNNVVLYTPENVLRFFEEEIGNV